VLKVLLALKVSQAQLARKVKRVLKVSQAQLVLKEHKALLELMDQDMR
jgi:hypothetical protein